jgi:hypothetical protein
MRIRIRGFDEQKLKKFTVREHLTLQNMKFLNFFYFCESFFALLDPDPDPLTWASIKASKLQEKLSASALIFALLDPDPVNQNQCGPMRIRIRNTGQIQYNLDPPVHGLNNYKDTNPKCRLYWYFVEFIDWRYSQSCWYFRSAL